MSRAARDAPARARLGAWLLLYCERTESRCRFAMLCDFKFSKREPARRIEPPCSDAEPLVRVAGTTLVRLVRTTAALRSASAASRRITPNAALRVLTRLEITNVHFAFLFICHNTFLGLLFLFSGCVSRAEELPSAGHLFVWNQVIQADQLLFRRLLPLSSTLPGSGVLFFLR